VVDSGKIGKLLVVTLGRNWQARSALLIHSRNGRATVNAVAARIAPSITTMIRMDHAHAFALFHRYKADTSNGRKRALMTNACLALEIHAQLEEEIFYPALRRLIGEDEVLAKSGPEHDEMKLLIGELRSRLAAADHVAVTVDDTFLKLMRAVIHHVADEETHLLPTAERLMKAQLKELGAEMTKRRVELLKPHAGEIAISAARSFPVGTAAGAVLVTAGVAAIGAMLMSRRRAPRRGIWRR
jgi:hemerythrin superfamily protein